MKRFRAAATGVNGAVRFPVNLVTARFSGVLVIRELKPAIGDGAEVNEEGGVKGFVFSETGQK